MRDVCLKRQSRALDFLTATDMPGQMKHYLNTIDQVPGERICLDHEHSGTSLAELEEYVRYILDVRPDLHAVAGEPTHPGL